MPSPVVCVESCLNIPLRFPPRSLMSVFRPRPALRPKDSRKRCSLPYSPGTDWYRIPCQPRPWREGNTERIRPWKGTDHPRSVERSCSWVFLVLLDRCYEKTAAQCCRYFRLAPVAAGAFPFFLMPRRFFGVCRPMFSCQWTLM